MRRLALLGLAVCVTACGCRDGSAGPSVETRVSPVLTEARERFTYRGKPIPPFFLTDFAGGFGAPDYYTGGSGYRICTVAVEGLFPIEGHDRSLYDNARLRHRKGFYTFDYGDEPRQPGVAGYFGYRFVGTAPCRITVLEYSGNTGGSAVCNGVILVRLEMEPYGIAGGKTERLVMRFVHDVIHGDRMHRDVKLDGNRLILGPMTTSLNYPNPVEPSRVIVLE